LIGEIYNEYYLLLGKYKLKTKEYDKTEIIINNYNEFLNQVLNEELENVAHIQSVKNEKMKVLAMVDREREIARTEKIDINQCVIEIEAKKADLLRLTNDAENMYGIKKNRKIDRKNPILA